MMPSTEHLWRRRLADRLAGPSQPVLHVAGDCWTTAALHDGAARWAAGFRSAGLRPGDRLVVAATSSPTFLHVLLAAIAEGLTLAPVPPLPADQLNSVAERLDARGVIAAAEPGRDRTSAWVEGSPEQHLYLRLVSHPATPDVRLLLRTSGSTGHGRWVGLSDANLQAVFDSHIPLLGLDGARVLSMLPWHHVFGLVLDLLASLLGGATIVRVPDGGRDLVHLLASGRAHDVSHLNAVPLVVQRLAEHPEGRALLEQLQGGIVGGAPVHEPLATTLRSTRLRVGYGQTEAGPGICLGEPGVWRDATIGRPLGCEVRVAADGELAFRGPNACVGFWSSAGFEPLAPTRWARTGDLVRAEPDGTLTFLGRTSSSFKLANGRMVEAARLEAAIREGWPAVREIALLPGRGIAVDILVAMQSEDGDPVAAMPASVVAILGALGRLPWRVLPVAAERWPRTPKGDTDRTALAALVGR